MRFLTMDELLAWLGRNSVPLTVALGAVTVVVLGALIRWTIKGNRVPGVIRVVGPLMGIGWNAEATYEVLRHSLGVPPLVAGIGFAVFEMLMIGAAIEAERHFQRRVAVKDPHPGLGPAKWFVFTIAALTATAAAFNSASIPVIIFRYAVAIAVVWYWALKFVPDHTRAEIKRTTWALSPRRILVRFGLIDPTDADLATVHHERQVRLLVSLARKIHHGRKVLRSRREARFVKAAELADETMMVEVVARIFRAEIALTVANPNTPPQRLTELTRESDARRRALLTPTDAVSIDASGRFTPAQPVRLTPTPSGSDVAAPRQLDAARVNGGFQFGPVGALNFDELTPEMFNSPQANGNGRRHDSGSSNVRQTPVSPEFSRQPALVRTVDLTPITDADARQRLTSVSGRDAQQRLADAETVWRDSESRGVSLTGRELGERFGMSESWGRTVIGNARKRDQAQQ